MIFTKLQKRIVYLVIVLGILLIPSFYVLAQETPAPTGDTGGGKTIDYGLGATAKEAYGTDVKKLENQPNVITGAIIGVVLAALGIIFMIQIIIAGIIWMGASGNEEKITKARNTIIHSTIGLVIVVGAYALVNYVLQGIFAAVFK